ncbi:MAG: hypothetical protein WC900_05595 [Oscillospiraceae bacterium]|jgi:hypothetical protein
MVQLQITIKAKKDVETFADINTSVLYDKDGCTDEEKGIADSLNIMVVEYLKNIISDINSKNKEVKHG